MVVALIIYKRLAGVKHHLFHGPDKDRMIAPVQDMAYATLDVCEGIIEDGNALDPA
jgi:hypothetical protein